SLAIRGAPALGVAGAFGVALAAREAIRLGRDPVRACRRAAAKLAGARPTAVNLSWGVSRAIERLSAMESARAGPKALLASLVEVGEGLIEEDLEASRRMARHGAPLVPAGRPVLTHCNTGGLATAGLGTALAVAREAFAAGRIPGVVVDETRPLLQGGRLTMWELRRWGIPARLICDGASAWAIRSLHVGAVLVGADRIAANGDTANKIGTLNLALAARASRIPFLVVAPSSSIDPETPRGDGIRIEERDGAEILRASGWPRGEGASAFNPAFDLTPSELVTAWVTERGVERPPF
ncbi:MAG: S-methyl-5-thioribose-1-phosphate isomerase, partial [Candidatus Eisenbacteria bacterium]|nr:S-methyl-5-thioribose-1-phosphate isomerase [Candidatus Eisenbacteria bacterium]